MKIVTAGSNHYGYSKTISYCKINAEKFGYDIHIYDMGGLGFGEPIADRRCETAIRQPKIAMKPELILAQLRKSTGTLAWIDGDATLIRSIDDVEQDSTFDVGVTVRPKAKVKKTQYINAGIFFAKCNTAAERFIEWWIASIPPTPEDLTKKHPGYCDQTVLEETLILPNIKVVPWDAFHTVHEIRGTRVKFFDCARYNNFWLHEQWLEPGWDTRILHFKNHSMKKLARYRAEFLDGRS